MTIALVGAGCSSPERPPTSGSAAGGGVRVEGLELRIDGAEGEQSLELRAQRASFTGLPGRGSGRLEEVEARLWSGEEEAGDEALRARARSASLSADGALELRRAELQRRGLSLTAARARLGLDGRVEASEVTARLSIAERGGGEMISRARAVTASFLVALATLVSWHHAAAEQQRSAAGQRSAELEVSADQVELERERRRAVFTGSVVLRHQELELRCDRLVAMVRDEGGLASVEATGRVRIEASGLSATAGAAQYRPEAGRLRLSGAPRVRSAAGELRGRSMVIDVSSGRVTIEGARGVFRIR